MFFVEKFLDFIDQRVDALHQAMFDKIVDCIFQRDIRPLNVQVHACYETLLALNIFSPGHLHSRAKKFMIIFCSCVMFRFVFHALIQILFSLNRNNYTQFIHLLQIHVQKQMLPQSALLSRSFSRELAVSLK